jgi:polysaccharide pyruvyl transferase WcaK-like protein
MTGHGDACFDQQAILTQIGEQDISAGTGTRRDCPSPIAGCWLRIWIGPSLQPEPRTQHSRVAAGRGVRVVIDNGEYSLHNKGDLAMLHVTLARLREHWPAARLGVVTLNPFLLRSYERDSEPLAFSSGGVWESDNPVRRLPAHLPPRIVAPVSQAWLVKLEPARSLIRRLSDGRVGVRPAPGDGREPATMAGSFNGRRHPPRAIEAVETASLVLALGGGYVADVDPDQTHRTFDLLARAMQLGIPTAMVGQGLGPLRDPELLRRARQILPQIDLIAIRERRFGPNLLESLGVRPERVVVTGDDAIELAFKVQPAVLGRGLGICLRKAAYAPVTSSAGRAIRRAVQGAALHAVAPLVPLAISGFEQEDARATLPLTEGYPDIVPMISRHSSAQELARRVSSCRVVVTGAYHAAVFALAQGVSVIGLSPSAYYDQKFLGLASMFPSGMTTVSVHRDDLESALRTAVEASWARADDVRPDLLKAAEEQLQASRRAYERVYRLVDGRDRD